MGFSSVPRICPFLLSFVHPRSVCSIALRAGKAGAAGGCPVGTSSAQALAGRGTSELAEGSGAAACVYVVAGEGVREDASSTGMKKINFFFFLN